jgi:hypothetical protein
MYAFHRAYAQSARGSNQMTSKIYKIHNYVTQTFCAQVVNSLYTPLNIFSIQPLKSYNPVSSIQPQRAHMNKRTT